MDVVLIFCAKYLFVLAFLIAAIFFFKQKKEVQIKIVFFGVTCALLSYGIALIAGHLYYNPRPFVTGHFKPLIEHDTENGFPSDHVLLVSAVAAVLSVFNKRYAIPVWIITIIIASARVYAGIHHIIDVVASCSLRL